MKNLLLFLAATMCILISCGDDEPEVSPNAPVISLTSPANGLTYMASDTILIEGIATDDGEIRSITFNNGADDSPLDISSATDKSSVSFAIDLSITATTDPGDYEVTVTATDDINQSTTETVTFTVIQ